MTRSDCIFKLCPLVLARFMEAAWSAGPREIPCQRNRVIEKWLANQAPQWHKHLYPIAGFEDPGSIEVCMAKSGNPRADYRSNRIWLGHVDYEEDRRSLAHEYLHLAFKHSPKALDEVFIEAAARRVLQGGS